MANCKLCHNQAINGQGLNALGNHMSCGMEWNKRHMNNMCLKCGKNPQPKHCAACSNCIDNNSDYTGYEEPE